VTVGFAASYEAEQRAKRSVIYVARVPLLGVAGGWKIGFTINLVSRAIGLVGDAGIIEFVALMHGTRTAETNIHRRLRAHVAPANSLRNLYKPREWYVDADQVRDLVAATPFVWRGSIMLRSVAHDPERSSGYDRDTSYTADLGRLQSAWGAALRGGR
jgi:hypothetical protein